MTTDSSNSLPVRGRPVHQPINAAGNKSVIVFLTVCTADRRAILANPQVHALLLQAWQRTDHWLVGRYVIMPDHIHLFCSPGTNPPVSLQTWVAYWKRQVAFAHGSSFWQKNYWDTQLRRHESYDGKWDYVRQNPVRAGVANRADGWPYQGEINILRWHD